MKNSLIKILGQLSEIKSAVYTHLIRRRIRVASLEETIKKLYQDRCSISRFGDGEFYIMEGHAIGFQQADPKLALRLKEVITSEHDKLLVGISNAINPRNYCEFTDKHIKWMKKNFRNTTEIRLKYLDTKRFYYNSMISRFWIPFRDKSRAKKVADMLKNIWAGRDAVIIEGQKTRMGIGNELLSETKSVKRIIGPAENAFSKYNELLNCAKTFPKDSLFLIALGPTATVLAYDLWLAGFQALDIGHVDLEYEWMKAGAMDQTLVSNKYVNELAGGKAVQECNDELYLSQIVYKVE